MENEIVSVIPIEYKEVFENIKGRSSIFFEGDPRKPLFIITHGYGSSFFDLLNLADKLIKEGFNIELTVLNAHCDDYLDKEMSYKKWYSRLEEIYLDSRKKFDEIYLIGFSLGGLLSLDLAQRHEVAGITGVSCFLGIDHSGYFNVVSNLLSVFNVKKVFRFLQASEMAVPHIPHLKMLPTSKMKMLIENGKVIKRRKGLIECKSLFFHSKDDIVASMHEIEVFSKHYGVNSKILTLEDLPHFLQFDIDPIIMKDIILNYFELVPHDQKKDIKTLEEALRDSVSKGEYIVDKDMVEYLKQK